MINPPRKQHPQPQTGNAGQAMPNSLSIPT